MGACGQWFALPLAICDLIWAVVGGPDHSGPVKAWGRRRGEEEEEEGKEEEEEEIWDPVAATWGLFLWLRTSFCFLPSPGSGDAPS